MSRATIGVLALRLDRDLAFRTVLRAELHEQQPQEVVDLGQRATWTCARRGLVRCSIATVGGMP